MDIFFYFFFLYLSLQYFLFVSCSLVVTCLERADFLALLFVTFCCVFVTLPYCVLGQVWYLIVSIPYLQHLPYFKCIVQWDFLKVL